MSYNEELETEMNMDGIVDFVKLQKAHPDLPWHDSETKVYPAVCKKLSQALIHFVALEYERLTAMNHDILKRGWVNSEHFVKYRTELKSALDAFSEDDLTMSEEAASRLKDTATGAQLEKMLCYMKSQGAKQAAGESSASPGERAAHAASLGSPERRLSLQLGDISARVQMLPSKIAELSGGAAPGPVAVDFANSDTWPGAPIPPFALMSATCLNNISSVEDALNVYLLPTLRRPALRDVVTKYPGRSGWTSKKARGSAAAAGPIQTAWNKKKSIFEKIDVAIQELGNCTDVGQALITRLAGCAADLKAKIVGEVGTAKATDPSRGRQNIKELEKVLRSEKSGSRERAERAKKGAATRKAKKQRTT